MNKQLPNATTVLVLGIISIVTSFCYGVIGLTLAIIALVLAKKDMQLYRQAPEEYTNFSNLNAGRICAIVGICISGLVILFVMIYLFVLAGIILPLAAAGA